ncbi:MAG: magnesium transporter CorA family protein [Deinococcus sp.]|nr:magnesium transporter CorA family protein [Deinococcus sp.]
MIEATDFSGQLVPWQANLDRRQLWLHVSEPTNHDLAALELAFPMNELAVEDALEPGHASHYEKYPQGDFLTFRTLANPEGLAEESERVSLFLYADSLLTLSRGELPYLARVRELVGRETVDSPAEIAFEILDTGAESFVVFMRALEDRIDELEQQMFGGGREDMVQTVFDLKQRLNHARRLCNEAQDALTLLARHASASDDDLLRFRDVRDSMNRLGKRLDTSRDNLSNLLAIHSSVQSQRMNEVMRTLAAVSTVFLPLTFLAGVWGMNFESMPELRWQFGYALAWSSFVLVAGVLAWIFRRRGWW